MTKIPDISLVICTWNGLAILKDCLPSIYNCTHDIDLQVILVDNGSEDQSVDWCRNNFPEVEIVELEKNEGFTTANNKGFELCQGRYVLLLNNDTVVQKNALNILFDFMESHKDVAACGPKLLNSDMSLQRSARVFPNIWTEFCQEFYLSALFPKSHVFSKYYMAYWEHDETMKVDFVTGAALMIRKEVLDEVGYLDEINFKFFYEETDLCLRLKKQSLSIYFVHEAEIVHLGGASYVHKSKLFHYHMLNSRYNYHIKHEGLLAIPALWLIHIISSIIYCIVCGFFAAFNIKRKSSLKLYTRYANTLRYHGRRLLNKHLLQ